MHWETLPVQSELNLTPWLMSVGLCVWSARAGFDTLPAFRISAQIFHGCRINLFRLSYCRYVERTSSPAEGTTRDVLPCAGNLQAMLFLALRRVPGLLCVVGSHGFSQEPMQWTKPKFAEETGGCTVELQTNAAGEAMVLEPIIHVPGPVRWF